MTRRDWTAEAKALILDWYRTHRFTWHQSILTPSDQAALATKIAAFLETTMAGRPEADQPQVVTADGLRASFYAIVVEADEWRPLADYINTLLAPRTIDRMSSSPRVIAATRALDPNDDR